jgi:hypothetical protein
VVDTGVRSEPTPAFVRAAQNARRIRLVGEQEAAEPDRRAV